ncbi:hypothetical protein CENTIMANUS_00233 [Klebsiella phage vB_KpM_Centimanus]
MPELTKEALLEGFLSDVKGIARYVARNTGTVEEACELMTHQFLTLLDGVGNSETPTPITLVVEAHPASEIAYFHENEPETDYVPEDTPINTDCMLHGSLSDFHLVPKAFYPTILNRYRSLIKEKGGALPTTPYLNAGHLLGMLDTLENDLLQSLSKKHRWLGYIQGILCAYGLTTVDVERDFTRKIFNGR